MPPRLRAWSLSRSDSERCFTRISADGELLEPPSAVQKKKKKKPAPSVPCARAPPLTRHPHCDVRLTRGARAHRHVIRAGTRLQFVCLFNYFIYFPCVLLAWQIKCICIAKRKCGVKTGEI